MPTVQQYRADLAELVRLANNDLAVLWRDVADARVARELLGDILPMLADTYGSAAAALSADWYDALREEQAIRGRFRAVVAELPDPERSQVLARWSVDPLFAAEPDHAAALSRAEGGLQRIIVDSGRDTVMGSSIADPGATGWQRSASGGCGFCRMLAGRGAVYSESTVNFGAHDHCRCVAVPAFEGQPRPVQPYRPGPGTTPEDRARTREWMRENGYTDLPVT